MDVTALLQSHGDDAPSGENLEYEQVFMEMEIAAQPGEERQAGDEILPGEDPDWGEVIEKATAVLEQSHDIRAATVYATAALNTKGLPGLADATAFIRGCVEEFWETCHPELDEDDGDATMRINAVADLGGEDTVVRALRRAPLTDSRTFGRISIRDIAIATGEIPVPEGAENVPDSAAISAAFQDTDDETLQTYYDAVGQCLEDVQAIETVFNNQTPGEGPNLDDLLKGLRAAYRTLDDHVGGDGAAEAEDGDELAEAGDGGMVGAPVAGGGGPMGAINSPSDVSNALDRIISYYRRAEPSSPVPVLLERAKRLVNADFLTIMKDMAPQGVENVNLIGGLEDEEGY